MKIVWSICFLVLVHFLSAQPMIEGVIEYEMKMNMHRQLPKDRPELRQMMPEYQVLSKELIFNRNASMFKDVVDDIEPSGGGRGMRFRMGSTELHIDLVNNRKLESSDLFGDVYLIDDELPILPWKLRGETKKIAGMVCQLAYYERIEDSTYVEAWFTPDIPLGIGPDMIRGLPGAVLEADINFGERIYTAKSVKRKEIKEKDLKAPTKGQRVDQATYDAVFKEKTEAMRARFGGGGRRGG